MRDIFEELKGKKLLVLGATMDDCQIVQAAKELGVYTITTDYHEDWDDAPAKKIADEAWNISWSDIPALKEKALLAGVDGVMAGYSEFRTGSAIRLSKELGTKFYIEDENQLAITRDKLLFKSKCREYGVPVAIDYPVTKDMNPDDLAAIKYPVVVKPTDNAGARGIRFCKDASKIVDCIEYALSFSESKRVVVEEALKGHGTTAYYVLADGKAAFSSLHDRYDRIEREGFNALPDAFVYPSYRLTYYMEHYDQNVRNLLSHMGLKNGVVGLQGFNEPDGRIVFSEMGYRLGGTSSFHYTEYFNQVSHMKMLISYSLTGNMHAEELRKEDPTFKGKHACTFSLLAKSGTIGYQSGKDEIDALPNVVYTCFYHKIGATLETDGSKKSRAFRAYIVGDTIQQLINTIHKIQDTIIIRDLDGNNMLYEPADLSFMTNYR